MQTLYEYVGKQQEVLTAENYNEVDAAVFAQLSYFKFENNGHAGEEGNGMSVSEYAQEALDNEKLYVHRGDSFSADEKAFLENISESTRYKNCSISNFEAPASQQVVDDNGEGSYLESQWAAFTVNINDGTDTAVVAMRGTDYTTLGWQEDFELAYDTDGTNAQILSAEYLKSVDAANIYTTGHSKGGCDVISGYIMSEDGVRERISRIDNFDGPGVNSEYRERFQEGYDELGDKLNNYYPQDSVIGRLLIDKPGDTNYVYAEVRPTYADKWIFGEHDLFAFMLNDGGTFEESKPSYLSDVLNESLDKAVQNLSLSQREQLVQIGSKLELYTLLAEIEMELYAENKIETKQQFGDTPESIQNVIAVWKTIQDAYNSMTEEEKDLLKETMGIALATACAKMVHDGKVAFEDRINRAKEKLKRKVEEVQEKAVDFGQSIIRTVKDIVEGIIEKVDALAKKVKGAIEKGYDKVEGILESLGISSEMLYVKPTLLKPQIGELRSMAKKIGQMIESLQEVKAKLSGMSLGMSIGAINQIINELNEEKRSCEAMADVLERIIRMYINTERKICAQ